MEEETAEIQEPINSSVDPGEGYRLLSDNEIVQPNDEREFVPITNRWRTADIANSGRFIGHTVGDIRNMHAGWSDVVFRRQIKPKEKSMKVAKFIGSWVLRSLNYWVTEPAMNIVKRIMWSVRYVTLTTMIAGCIYGYNYPDHLKSFLSSCLPKITIEAPEIMR